MRTVYILKTDNGMTEDAEELLLRIQSVLENGSDIYLTADERRSEYATVIHTHQDVYDVLSSSLEVIRDYFLYFDYLICSHFEMMLRTLADDPSFFRRQRIKPPDIIEDFYTTCKNSANNPDDPFLFWIMMNSAMKRSLCFRQDQTGRLSVSLPALSFDEEEFFGEAMCLRDRLIYEYCSRDPEALFSILSDRIDVFEYHNILPDDTRESILILDKLSCLSSRLHRTRSYYSEAVFLLMTNMEYDQAARLAKEGLSADFEDTPSDRNEVARLLFFIMKMEDEPTEKAGCADRLLAFVDEKLLPGGQSILDSMLIDTAKVYHMNGQYEKALSVLEPIVLKAVYRSSDTDSLLDAFDDLSERVNALCLYAVIAETTDTQFRTNALIKSAAEIYHKMMYLKESKGFFFKPLDEDVLRLLSTAGQL